MSVYDMLGGEVIACDGPRTRALRGRRGASTARASCARVGSNRRPPQSSSAGSGRPHSTVGRWKSGSSRHSSGGSNGGGVASGCLVEPMSAHSTARPHARALGTTETAETRARRREQLMGFWCSVVRREGGAQLSGARPLSSLELETELARSGRKCPESFNTDQECSRKLGECSRKLGECSRKLGFMRVRVVSGRAPRKRSARGN